MRSAGDRDGARRVRRLAQAAGEGGRAAGVLDATSTTSTSTTSTSTTPSSSAAGLSVFNSNGCSGCHTLSAAKATGTVGPDLDKLVAYAKQANQPLESFVHESIVDPDAYIQPGYPKGVMPPDFGQNAQPGRSSTRS